MRILAGLNVRLLLLVLIACSDVLAQDLGVVGRVYPIMETDLLVVFEQKAHESVIQGDWSREMDASAKRARDYVARPPGQSLPVVDQAARRLFDPTLVIPYDLRDAEGRLLYPAGTQINPLRVRPFSKRLAFFDGDDSRQRRWADELLADDWQTLPILVQGPVMAMSQAWERQVYFDQGGHLVARFGIQRVPTLVYQESPESPWLTLEEILLEDKE